MGRVQTFASVSTAVNGSATVAVPVEKATKAGNCLILRCYGSAGCPASVTDEAAHTWVGVISSSINVGLYYCLDAAAFAPGDTVTLNGVVGSRVVIAQIDEYDNIAATNPFNRDINAQYNGWATSAFTGGGAPNFPQQGTIATNSPWVAQARFPTQFKMQMFYAVGIRATLTDAELQQHPLITGNWQAGFASISASAPIRQPGTKTVHGLFVADGSGETCGATVALLTMNRKTNWQLIQWNFNTAATPAPKPITLLEFYNTYKDKTQPMKLAAFITSKEQAGELVGYADQWLIQLNVFSIQSANASVKPTTVSFQSALGGMVAQVGAQKKVIPVNRGT